MKVSNLLFPIEVFSFVGSGILLGIGKWFSFMMVFTLAIVLAIITGKQIEKEERLKWQVQ